MKVLVCLSLLKTGINSQEKDRAMTANTFKMKGKRCNITVTNLNTEGMWASETKTNQQNLWTEVRVGKSYECAGQI